MKRGRIDRRKSQRIFKNTAGTGRVNLKNRLQESSSPLVMRGGIRL
jgi:hypothetical protein